MKRVAEQPPHDPLLIRACRGQPVERTPVWLMRQAGRYLPEYRAIRKQVDFLTLCQRPDLATEVTLQPVRRFGLDAAILFSDIMVPLLAMGVQLHFAPGPVIAEPLRDAAALARLRKPHPEDMAPYVMETLKMVRRSLPQDVAVVGFAGAPLTLAAYLVEGTGSKDFSHLRALVYGQPKLACALLDDLAECTLGYLQAQIRAGAQAVQLFDTWAGILSEPVYRKVALPGLQKIMQGLKASGVPRIYFAQDAAALLGAIAEIGADGLGIDWRLDLQAVRRQMTNCVFLQGNLDPAVLLTHPGQVRAHTREVLCRGRSGPHIFNLGHGLLPQTPVENVAALVEAVREMGS